MLLSLNFLSLLYIVINIAATIAMVVCPFGWDRFDDPLPLPFLSHLLIPSPLPSTPDEQDLPVQVEHCLSTGKWVGRSVGVLVLLHSCWLFTKPVHSRPNVLALGPVLVWLYLKGEIALFGCGWRDGGREGGIAFYCPS